jgi:hypothetical protein
VGKWVFGWFFIYVYPQAVFIVSGDILGYPQYPQWLLLLRKRYISNQIDQLNLNNCIFTLFDLPVWELSPGCDTISAHN